MFVDLDWPLYASSLLSASAELLVIILVTHPRSYIETTDRRDFGGKPSKWWWRRVLSWKIPEFCSVGGARSIKQHFSRFRVPFDYPAHSLQETVLPQTSGTDGKPRLWRCAFLLVWRVCDQAFGRYRPLNGAEKWSRDHYENWKFAYRHTQKIHWFQKCYYFRSTMKNNEVIAENPFQNSGVTRRLWTLGRLELTLVVNTSF